MSKQAIKSLKMGILPKELNYNIEKDEVDFDKLRYNSYYKSPEFWINKFENPTAFMNLPGYEKIIDYIIGLSVSPLEEMEERISQSNIDVQTSEKCSVCRPEESLEQSS